MDDNGADHEAGGDSRLAGSWPNGAGHADAYSRSGEVAQMKDDARWAELKCTLTGMRGDIKGLHGRMDDFGDELAINTAMTKQLQEIKTTWKVGTRVLLWLGAAGAAVTAIYVNGYQWLHGGKLPPQ